MDPGEYERSFDLEATHWWFRAKRALVLALLRRFVPPGPRGLDVGCGTGGMLSAASGSGAWVGVDVEPLALAFCRKRGLTRLAAGSATALPFRAGAFDACLCLDLLYHRGVASEAEALAECRRVLGPGGILVITDSAFAWLRSGHDAVMHGRRRYTRGELLAHVRRAGFTPVFASYAYCLVFLAVAAVRLARRMGCGGSAGSDVSPVPATLNRALLLVQALERALLRVVPLPFGSSVVCVARRSP